MDHYYYGHHGHHHHHHHHHDKPASPSRGKRKTRSPQGISGLRPVEVDESHPQRALKSSIMVEKPTEKLRTSDKITTIFEIASICLAAATTAVVAKQSWSSRKEAPNQLYKR